MAFLGDPTSDRHRTDASLDGERGRADDELVTRSIAAAEDADELIQIARERARAVLELARGREDGHGENAAELGHTRAADDRTLADEYATADRALHDERTRRRLAIRQLLALERYETDEALANERAAADSATIGRESLDTIVHDLRSMLSAVTLNAATLVLGADRGKPVQQLVELGSNIQHAAAQMELLLADLQDLAAIDAGRARLVPVAQDLLAVVRTAVEIHQSVATANGLTLIALLPPEPLVLSIDAPRFTRALTNLLANAIKFTPRGGAITVEVAQLGDAVELSVTDTGPGIPPELHDAIFERFHQAGTSAARAKGVGLGLYIARSIVLAHGGRIWVESATDHGATFRVRLPVRRPPTA